jgi:hypothetical protein
MPVRHFLIETIFVLFYIQLLYKVLYFRAGPLVANDALNRLQVVYLYIKVNSNLLYEKSV